MGRKRLEATKDRITLSVDPKLNEQLKEVGVNRSRLFEIAAKIYLRKINRS